MTIDAHARHSRPRLDCPEGYLRRLPDDLTGPRLSKAHYPVTRTIDFTTERLAALAEAKGVLDSGVREVQSVCKQKAGRSQIAAGLTEHLSGGRVQVRSGGSMPANKLNPGVTDVMAEIGLDLSEGFSKPTTDDVVQAADVVVTMGAGDTCPTCPPKRYRDWKPNHHSGLRIDKVRQIRDTTDEHARALLTSLEVMPA